MPSLEENRRFWDQDYAWELDGAEWSWRWGHPDLQWMGTLLPRLRSFVPAETALEIGPGHGRWSHYLRSHCSHLILLDLSQSCIEHCRKRFAGDPGVSFQVGDGRHLVGVPDRSVDLVFSFDSLVHCEADVIETYLQECARVLRPDGIGFIHHSNLHPFRRYFRLTGRLPYSRRLALYKLKLLDLDHWRAPSMSAERFADMAERAGLECIRQELVGWGTRRLIDSFSLVTPRGSAWSRPRRVVENHRFMREADRLLAIDQTYGMAPVSGPEPQEETPCEESGSVSTN